MMFLMSGCSGSASFSIGGQTVEEAAEELIAGDLAELIGLGELTPACPEVEDPEVGTTFRCTAETPAGQTIDFDGVVDEEDHINLEATNLVPAAPIEERFYEILDSQSPGSGLAPDGVDCGDEMVVLVDRQMTCEVRVGDATPRIATLTITDVSTRNFEFAFESTVEEESSPTTEAAPTEAPTAATDLEAIAQAAVLETDDFNGQWSEEPQTPSTVDYGLIDGCEFLGDLIDNDGFLVEADSSEFSSGDITVDHSIRIYADSSTATDVVLFWAQQAPIDCVVLGAEQAAGAALSSGELAPFEEVTFSLQSYENHIDEPRSTNLELTNTLIAPDQELVIINDQYFIQSGRVVSSVGVISPDTPWETTPDLLDLVAERTAEAAAAAGG